MLLQALFLCVLMSAASAGCTGKKKIMYFFDRERQACFPILTDDCDKEASQRFDSKRICERRLPMDRNSCPANSPSVKRADGKSHCFREGPEAETTKCPEGSYCNFGYMVGMCCDNKINDEYEENMKAACPDEGKAILIPGDEFGRTYFGKECAHNFCPADAACVQGKYLAYCCLPKI